MTILILNNPKIIKTPFKEKRNTTFELISRGFLLT
jgi:hypothetical protein